MKKLVLGLAAVVMLVVCPAFAQEAQTNMMNDNEEMNSEMLNNETMNDETMNDEMMNEDAQAPMDEEMNSMTNTVSNNTEAAPAAGSAY